MRLAARRDENENLLAHTARSMGAWMVYVGPLDWLCGYKGRWTPVEIKRPKGKYTPSQVKFLALAKANNLPVYVWRTVEDVITCLNTQPSSNSKT